MAQRDKLIQSILDNPKDVRFDDACKIATLIGFTGFDRSGSHNGFSRPNEIDQLDFQNRGGKIPPYQAKQLGKMIRKYWDLEKGEPK